MIDLTLFYPGGLSRTSGLYLDRWWLMGHAGLSKYKQSAHNTQGKVIGISLCLHSLVTAGPKDPSAWTVTWMPGVLSAQSGFNQHANNVNKCKREPLKRRSLTSYFFLFSYCYACVYAIMYPYHTIPLFFFFLILNVLNLARQLRAQIAKPLWPELINFPWAGLSFLFSCKKSTQNGLFFSVLC